MSGKYADGVYGRRGWTPTPEEAAMPPQGYLGPFQSNQERLISQSLATWTMSAAELQQYVRPPLPQINMFPERFGYTDQEVGIADIVELPSRTATAQRVESDFSQTPNTTQSSSRNTLGQV